MRISGIVTEGYRIASGSNAKGVPGPGGEMLKDSFVRQRPFFEKEIPGLIKVWTGTINLNIAPRKALMQAFDYTITCEWHPGLTETFGVVSRITLYTKDRTYGGCFIYYPLPSDIHTPRHEIIEILAPKVAGLSYGDKITIEVPDGKVSIA